MLIILLFPSKNFMPVVSSLRKKYLVHVKSKAQASIKWTGVQGKLSIGFIVCYAFKNLKYLQVAEIKFCTIDAK